MDDSSRKFFDPEEYGYLVWCTAEGELREISDMSTKHIKNCVRLLQKANPSKKHYDNPPEYVKTIGYITSDTWCNYYGERYLEEFAKELKKRGLRYKDMRK